ncbi:hypothetical protein JCM8097_005700 [Rhodosporidiobolus ruineniae]
MHASLLTLPFELLQHIVLLAILPDEAVSQYKDRQRTLAILCMTSKMLCQVAQPLLWRVFVPTSNPIPILEDNPQRAQEVYVARDEITGFSARPFLSKLNLAPTFEA